MGVYYTPPDRTVQKHLFWLASHRYIDNVCYLTLRRDSMRVKQRHSVHFSSLVQPSCLALRSTRVGLLDPCLMLAPLQSVITCYSIDVVLKFWTGTTSTCTWVVPFLQV